MTTSETNNYQGFTKLPVQVMQKANSAGGVVVVQTPHKGEVLIDLQEIHRAMFSANRTDERLATKIVSELRTLEIEARGFLLKEWVSNYKK